MTMQRWLVMESSPEAIATFSKRTRELRDAQGTLTSSASGDDPLRSRRAALPLLERKEKDMKLGIIGSGVVAQTLGAKLVEPVSDLTLRRLFGAFLLLVSVKMMWGK